MLTELVRGTIAWSGTTAIAIISRDPYPSVPSSVAAKEQPIGADCMLLAGYLWAVVL